MHRSISLALLVITLIAVFSCGAPRLDGDAETDALRSRIEDVQAAEAAHDVKAAISFWAEDAIFQSAGIPQIEGREAIGDFLRQFFESGQLKEFSSTTTHMSVSEAGDLAYEYGINQIVLSGPEGDMMEVDKFLTVWKKVDGKWFMAAVSANSGAQEPVPYGGEH